MEKLIITCAPTGSLTIPTQIPYLPFKCGVKSILKKLGVLTTIFFIILLTFPIIPITPASPDVVYSDLSDGHVGSYAGDVDDSSTSMWIGDRSNKEY